MSQKTQKTNKNQSATRWPRRKFIQSAGAAAVAAGVAPAIMSCGDDSGGGGGGTNELRILQRSHFVPRYDTWFDNFVEQWGEANGIKVTVTRADSQTLVPLADADFAAGEGHDLIEFISAPSAREPDVLDLKDINELAVSRFGAQTELCRNNSRNPKSEVFYGFCHGWTPLPNLYRKSLWTPQSMENGPTSWADVRTGGKAILEDSGEVVGIGISDELDSNQSLRAILWSFGGSVQNASGVVAINSAETIAALDFVKGLFEDTGDLTKEDVFNWTASSNNQALISGNASLVNNPISAYRTAQTTAEAIADDTFLVGALDGPTAGSALTPDCCTYTYVIPSYVTAPDVAKDFLMALLGSYNEAVQNAELYNLPAFPGTAPGIEDALKNDPTSKPTDKLTVLADATDWTVNLGYPGVANPAIGEVRDSNLIPQMFRAVADPTVGKTATEAAAEAETAIQAVFDKWSDSGLV